MTETEDEFRKAVEMELMCTRRDIAIADTTADDVQWLRACAKADTLEWVLGLLEEPEEEE